MAIAFDRLSAQTVGAGGNVVPRFDPIPNGGGHNDPIPNGVGWSGALARRYNAIAQELIRFIHYIFVECLSAGAALKEISKLLTRSRVAQYFPVLVPNQEKERVREETHPFVGHGFVEERVQFASTALAIIRREEDRLREKEEQRRELEDLRRSATSVGGDHRSPHEEQGPHDDSALPKVVRPSLFLQLQERVRKNFCLDVRARQAQTLADEGWILHELTDVLENVGGLLRERRKSLDPATKDSARLLLKVGGYLFLRDLAVTSYEGFSAVSYAEWIVEDLGR